MTIYKTKVYIFNTRGVAQSGRVSALGAESRRFESCLPDQILIIMKKAIIKKPAKTNMQSGLNKTKNWTIEFEFDSTLKKDVLMGWNSSSNTSKQLKMNFVSLEDAINWCKQNSYQYIISDQTQKTIKPKNYASNFSNNRKVSWTH